MEKLFLYAKIFKESNDLIKELIIQNAYLLPATQIKNILAILYHIDVWSSNWEESFASFQQRVNSIFYFDNSVKFPRFEISNLNNYYELLIN